MSLQFVVKVHFGQAIPDLSCANMNALRKALNGFLPQNRRVANLRRLSNTIGLQNTSDSRKMSSIPRRLVGKVAIVTASTDGIGYAIAHRLAQEGARVMVSSRKLEKVQKAVDKLQTENLEVSGMVCHVGKPEHRTKLIEETVKTYGKLDILVSNAAVNPHMGNLFESTEAQWDKLFDINIKSAFFLVKEAFPHLEKTSGSVIFITSIGGYVPFELIGPYCVTKTALLGLIKTLAPVCAEKHIRVNGIAPGIIKTKFSKALWESEAAESATKDGILLKRLGVPDDVSGAAAFLASDDAQYVTGETLVIAGGMTSHL